MHVAAKAVKIFCAMCLFLHSVAEERFSACCCLAEVAGKDIAQVCSDIVSQSWLCLGSEDAQANIDMDMVRY